MDKVKSYWQDYFENVSPSWMENWYEDLKDLTIPSVYFKITREECKELMKLVDGDADDNIIGLIIDKLWGLFSKVEGDRVFARLGSRSPKDNLVEMRKPKDVLQAFGDSERVLEDLMLCINVNYEPYLFIRKWVDIPRSKEFRCFVKNKELKGITQYFYREKYYYLDEEKNRVKIKAQAQWLLDEINKKFKLKNFIFDFVFMFIGDENPLLIEINPYSSWTDPCLFDFAIDKFDKFEFRWLQSLEGV